MVVKPVCKRKADPRIVQKLWAAINYIRNQKQVANIDRIVRYLQRQYEIKQAEANEQLRLSVEDKLISTYKAVSQKGSNVGVEQEGYKVERNEGDEEDKTNTHDWYCYDCHQGGEVLECEKCWRVYHQNCTDEDTNTNTFVCSVCKDMEGQPRMKRKSLNTLLSFTIVRLKEKSKELHWFGGADLGLNLFVFNYMDLNTMQEKTTARKYKFLQQFFADARTILHNIFICYGDNGVIPHLARIMIRDCKYDLDEIRQCKDCYYHSNSKPKDWFCEPCRPPHELVYAKQKGFSYWPAKVIKITPEGYDVRFFGTLHQRAVIPNNSIKPISTMPKQLKRSSGFNKAMRELERHQELLTKSNQDEELDSYSTADNEGDEEKEEVKAVKHYKKYKAHQHSIDPISENIPPTPPSNKYSATNEDTYLVSSSEDKVKNREEVAVQTCKQQNLNNALQVSRSSFCENADCKKIFEDELKKIIFKMEEDFKKEKEIALKEQEERLWKESEEQEQKSLRRALISHERELERMTQQLEEKLRTEFAEEAKNLAFKHKHEISIAKRKQWCYNCEEEAMYHCCWNTSYCSIKCQQSHWHTEHKRSCRRKRS